MLLGALAGGFGGWVDSLLMRLTDIMLAVPGLLFAITDRRPARPQPQVGDDRHRGRQLPVFARLLRASMLGQREADYVLAARSLGVKQHTDRDPARAAQLASPR